ncbi:hypothetical protein M8J77_019058 [Diaphorina citri]|nr:hypothetical protein M8J77_019058 [Diaphorina citri]
MKPSATLSRVPESRYRFGYLNIAEDHRGGYQWSCVGPDEVLMMRWLTAIQDEPGLETITIVFRLVPEEPNGTGSQRKKEGKKGRRKERKKEGKKGRRKERKKVRKEERKKERRKERKKERKEERKKGRRKERKK